MSLIRLIRSFVYFINCLIFSKKCGKSISFSIIGNLFVKLAIVFYCILFLFLVLLFLFFLDFLLLFFLDSLVLLVFLFQDSLVFLFFLFLVLSISFILFLLGLTFLYFYMLKKIFFFIIIYMSCDLGLSKPCIFIILYYHSVYDHQTWQDGNLP